MTIRQSEKQRLSSLDIERRFPIIPDRDIRIVYLDSLRNKAKSTKNYYVDNLQKNNFVLRNICYKDSDIQDYINTAYQTRNASEEVLDIAA
jgi:hypothetical protein|tara:strand:+ start:266 stop:538 length:273 start_codon:yes stop_codon:yes gene_type:complete